MRGTNSQPVPAASTQLAATEEPELVLCVCMYVMCVGVSVCEFIHCRCDTWLSQFIFSQALILVTLAACVQCSAVPSLPVGCCSCMSILA